MRRRYYRSSSGKPMRCNYCDNPPTVFLKRLTWYSRMGQRCAMTLWAATCAEHEGCVNWQSQLALYPDAAIEKRA